MIARASNRTRRCSRSISARGASASPSATRSRAVAHPLTTIDAPRAAPRFDAIAALIAEWQPALLVVGLPVHADGTPHAMTARAGASRAQLEARFGCRSRSSTSATRREVAEHALRAAGARRARARECATQVAAQIILQAWLDDAQRLLRPA